MLIIDFGLVDSYLCELFRLFVFRRFCLLIVLVLFFLVRSLQSFVFFCCFTCNVVVKLLVFENPVCSVLSMVIPWISRLGAMTGKLMTFLCYV